MWRTNTEDTHLSTFHTHTYTSHNRGLHRSQQYLTSAGSSSPPLTALRNIPISHLVRSGELHFCRQTPAQSHNVEAGHRNYDTSGGRRSIVAAVSIRRFVLSLHVSDEIVLARDEIKGEGVRREGYHLRTPDRHVTTLGARTMKQKQTQTLIHNKNLIYSYLKYLFSWLTWAFRTTTPVLGLANSVLF